MQLSMFLKRLGCDFSNEDQSLYLLRNGKGFISLLGYIDDIYIFLSWKTVIELMIKSSKPGWE